jgi:tRNA threonylcarbamoyladenosine biosynthesis protein TsaE
MTMHVSLQQLEDFAKAFWDTVKDAKVFAFHGTMGAGKTTTIAALCNYKGVQDAIGSPTYSIINEYSFKQDNEPKKIYHIDLYRLKDDEEVLQAGVEECVYSNEICFVEWPEKAPFLFDNNTIHVVVELASEIIRQVSILPANEYSDSSITEQL